MWLNSQSELRFPTRFNGEKREVYMEGEVYLEVKRDEERPFIVYAGETEIRVLGTSFNVKAYAEEGEVVTTLLSGKVSVGVGERSTKLDPGKQAIWNRKEDRISVRRWMLLAIYPGPKACSNLKISLWPRLPCNCPVGMTFSSCLKMRIVPSGGLREG